MPILRVMTYNVLYGGIGRERLIRDVVSAIAPHIAIFTEAHDAESFDAIASAVGPYRARAGSATDRSYPVVVSRWPIVDSDRHGPPWAPMKWIAATTAPFGGPSLTVLGVHLVPQPLWPFELWRYYETGALLKIAAQQTDEHLFAGDFNALSGADGHRLWRAPWWVRAQWLLQAGRTPRWALGRLTRAGYVDCYRECNPDKAGFTVPAWDPQGRIDYLLASPHLRQLLRSSDTPAPTAQQADRSPRRSLAELLGREPVTYLNGEASDHLPVWADFDWSDSGPS